MLEKICRGPRIERLQLSCANAARLPPPYMDSLHIGMLVMILGSGRVQSEKHVRWAELLPFSVRG